MTEKEFLDLYNGYKNKYKSDEDRPNNNIFSILNEAVLRECIARGFAVRGYKVTAEVLYKDKGSGSLDLLITDEKKYYAFELKIEKDSARVACGIRDMISDAHRLVIDKENNYKKKNQDVEKYTVLLVDPKYIYENIENKRKRKWSWDFYETLLKALNKNEGEELDCNEICNKVEEIISKESNNKSKNNKDEDKKNNDTEKWLDCSRKMKEIKLTIKQRTTITKIDDYKKIEIILFKCEKKETDNQKKDDTSNS
jgi:hypothetical protein